MDTNIHEHRHGHGHCCGSKHGNGHGHCHNSEHDEEHGHCHDSDHGKGHGHCHDAETGSDKGKNKGGGFGSGGFCICAKCGEKISHQKGVKCTTLKCPSCGKTMVREELLKSKH